MKKIIIIMLVLAISVCFCTSFTAATVYQYGDWTLTMIKSAPAAEFGVKGYQGENPTAVIPNDYGGYPITAVNPYAFAANHTLTHITMGGNITGIGSDAFLAADHLVEVTLTPSVVSIGESAFSATPALKSVNLEDTAITEISPNLFINSGIEEIALPDTCTAIGENAFAACDSLVKITIPSSVTSINDSAFAGDNVVIYCPADSYASTYAEENSIEYVLTDNQPAAYLCGDADGDGTVSILDATKIQRLLASLIGDDDGMIALRGDVNGGGLDILDATAIQRFLAGYENIHGIGEEIILA